MLSIEKASVHIVTVLLLTAQAWGAGSLADAFKAGGNRLVATQNNDGGWDWPLFDAYPKFSNAPNILAPTGMGLLQAYLSPDPNHRDPNQLAALQKAGGYLLNKRPWFITPDDGYLAVALDSAFGVTTYTDYVKKNFYEPLARGTYNYLGDGILFVNTAQYVNIIGRARDYQGLSNYAAFDCGVGLYSAHLIGADTSAWLAGTKAEINCLNGACAYDVLGLAGAVLGLASVGANVDPTAGTHHVAAHSLSDLAGILASYQLSTGGFTWNSLNKAEGAANETVQETAFAILALSEFDGQKYITNIKNAATYLQSVELPTGGWQDFVADGENNEVTGESLSALAAAHEVQSKKP
jgi:hypothetical protein